MNPSINSLSSHVLDTSKGKPASNIKVVLTTPAGQAFTAYTDEDGRCKNWGDVSLVEGSYCLRFYCKEYLLEQHQQSFYPFVDIHFDLTKNGGHYHVPLLISPFGFSSYRGS